MAEKSGSKNKIIAIAASVIVVAVAVVLGIIICKNKGSSINDDFFKSDDGKIVYSSSADDPEAAQLGAIKLHQVYKVDGDKITSATVYAEFENEEKAKAASENEDYKNAITAGDFKDGKVNGKYIVLEMPEASYAEMSASALRQSLELLEKIKNGEITIDTNEETEADEEVEYTFVEETSDESEESTEEPVETVENEDVE